MAVLHRYCLFTDINCGKPEDAAGSNYVVNDYTYGSSFVFTCAAGNSPTGTSATPGQPNTVTCQADGYWSFGSLQCFSWLLFLYISVQWKRSGSVVECLNRDRRAAGWSLTGVTALCPWARHIDPSLVLVQPRKTSPDITDGLLIGT